MNKVQLEALLKENPGAMAAAAMATIQLRNQQTGRVNKATTALGNRQHPSHKKAVGIFQKLRDKFKKKEDEPMSKADQYKALMQKTKDDAHYAKQYAARTAKTNGEGSNAAWNKVVAAVNRGGKVGYKKEKV